MSAAVSIRTVPAKLALERAVLQIKQRTADHAEGAWWQGKALTEIREKQLWRLGRDGEGLVFSCFEKFVAANFEFTVHWAYALMCLVRFKTPAVIREIGVWKALLLLKVDEAERRRLLPLAPGLTKRQLQASVTAWRRKE